MLMGWIDESEIAGLAALGIGIIIIAACTAYLYPRIKGRVDRWIEKYGCL
jgi:hypothetical protein